MSLPTITAQGRLAVEPQKRRTASGMPVCRARLECSDERGRTTFLNVDLVGPTAHAVAASMSAGDHARADGRLRVRKTNAGHTVYAIEADDFRRVDLPADDTTIEGNDR